MRMNASVRRLERSLTRVARTHYPAFLFGGRLAGNDIPVFVYHEVDASDFAADLRFLADNGYRTLTTDEFVQHHRGTRVARGVLLTFDDARRNFWDVTFPVLSDFSAHATLFVPTYWMGGGSGPMAGGDDAAGAAEMFMTWEQIRACAHSGLVDVQSHGHRHALVYTSPRLVSFASPQLIASHQLYDWPMRHEDGRDIQGAPALGTPIYEAEPVLSASRRVLEDPGAVAACRAMVAAGGGAAFFARPDAVTALTRAHTSAIRGRAPWVASGQELRWLVADEFLRSRECFERELGTIPRYFAYPWMLGSEHSLAVAMDAGIRAVFGVGLDVRRARRLLGPILAFGRIKGDWLRFLPGHGRRRLLDVAPEKVRGFVHAQHLAH
jgi:peptidoglycan/xylan/chitin deacetylase (PgdA/CDA1 family)